MNSVLLRRSPRQRNAFTVVKTFDDKNSPPEDSPIFTFKPIKPATDIEEENERANEEQWSEEEVDVAVQNDMELDEEGETEEEVIEPMEEEENDQIEDENERCEGQGGKKYAPEYVNPYYTKIPSTDIDMFERTSKMDKFDGPKSVINDPMQEMLQQGGYLSLKFLLDLAMNQVDWQILRRRSLAKFKYESNDKREQEEKTLKDMDFLGLTEEPGPDLKIEDEEPKVQEEVEVEVEVEVEETDGMSEEKNKPRPAIWIPMRRQTGELVWMGFKAGNLKRWKGTNAERVKQLAAIKRIFARFWIKMFRGPDAEYVAGFRARYSTDVFDFPLIVVPGESISTLGAKGYATKLLSDTVDAINEKHRKIPEMGRKPIKTTINKKTSKQSEIKTQKFSKKQPGFRARKDVDNHKYVKIGDNPLGLYSTYIRKEDFHTYMKSLEKPRVELRKRLKAMDAARSIPSEEAYQKLIEANANGDIIELEQLSDSQKKGQKTVLDAGSMTTLSSKVSSLKIINAIGNRTTKNAPGKIMGMSASQCAHDNLGWAKLQTSKEDKSKGMMLRNGLYMAEWLHLSAFSWGGLLEPPVYGKINPQQHDSSDIPENLVLGTSETNSQMTRFEKAWQALIKDETLLRKDNTYSAVLEIVRNPTSEKDILQDGKAAKYTRHSVSLGDSHDRLAKDFKFIAYSVEYSLDFPSGCRLLGKKEDTRLSTIFYPFSRPLYHKLEAELDTLLYNHLKVVSGLIKPPQAIQPGVTGTHGSLGNTVAYNTYNDDNLFGPATLDIGFLGVLQISDKPQLFNKKAHTSDKLQWHMHNKIYEHSTSHTNPVGQNASVAVTFKKPFKAPPKVLVWFTEISQPHGWRSLWTYANKVTETGLTVNIETWCERQFEAARVAWLAWPEDKDPKVFTAIDWIDIPDTQPTGSIGIYAKHEWATKDKLRWHAGVSDSTDCIKIGMCWLGVE
ncbi:uncharacterized protein FSUBG_1515 [Fusarium subglutinans]|uniref:H-type lectin domain-containing protein n=1 Tax=Gibberella subglutinans TaxID=42677 RepID=A0A8H5V7W9_GIBSU|nr:uncharacterized protein FSUBG_1515 [Fusarium subglutinans]KAF5612438.1 hypothetical protein FSUBG_1515 [Fusarium subglutinans]